ncbi:hypothetical protein Fmac_001890 [Flemingia macrophylla]|uniref:Cytochrome P450 n=1 Tax=Flemingia macrophylla TaxID=520843 RepID=A0ABD1NIE1_9FABA
MDSKILNLLSLITPFFLCVIVALKLRRNVQKTKSSPNIPPGPWKLPIIGSIHHLITSTPHRKLSDLAKVYGPLMHLQLGEIFTIIVSSSEHAEEIMKTHDVNFASRPRMLLTDIVSYGYTNIAFAPYGNYWRQVRKLCTVHLLSQKRVKSFQSLRENEFTSLVTMLASHNGSPVNLTETVSSSIYNVVSRAIFGTKCEDREDFILLIKEAAPIAAGLNIADLFPSAKWLQLVTGLRPKIEKMQRQIERILENIINEHKETQSKAKGDHEDLVDVLLKFHDGNDRDQDICLTNNNIKAIMQDLFAAGGETSSNAINWAMAEMVKNPRVMKKAQVEVREVFDMKRRVDENCIDELKYLKSVVMETLRLHPPAPFLLPRENKHACEIGRYEVPVKTKVIINAWAIGRDPNYWTESEKFYPERFIDSSIDYNGRNFNFIPFGAGRRICPGITMAAANIEVALAFLLYHFDWKLPNGLESEDMDMTEVFGAAVRRKDDLYLIPVTSRPLLIYIVGENLLHMQ